MPMSVYVQANVPMRMSVSAKEYHGIGNKRNRIEWLLVFAVVNYGVLRYLVGIHLVLLMALILGAQLTSAIPCNILVVNLLQTPEGILPEWYLTPFFAIIKAIPDKYSGIVVLVGGITAVFASSIPSCTTVRGGSVHQLPYRTVSVTPLYLVGMVYAAT